MGLSLSLFFFKVRINLYMGFIGKMAEFWAPFQCVHFSNNFSKGKNEIYLTKLMKFYIYDQLFLIRIIWERGGTFAIKMKST